MAWGIVDATRPRPSKASMRSTPTRFTEGTDRVRAAVCRDSRTSPSLQAHQLPSVVARAAESRQGRRLAGGDEELGFRHQALENRVDEDVHHRQQRDTVGLDAAAHAPDRGAALAGEFHVDDTWLR